MAQKYISHVLDNYDGIFNKTRGYTINSNPFTPDNVLCTALFKILHTHFTFNRVEKEPVDINNATIIYDLDSKNNTQFNRKLNIEKRSNGLQYSTFGLVWKEFGTIILPDDTVYQKNLAPEFDYEVIEPLDSYIFNGEENKLGEMLNSFNPLWSEDAIYGENIEQMYEKALEFAYNFLVRTLEIYKIKRNCITEIENTIQKSEDKTILFVQSPAPIDWILDFISGYVDVVNFVVRESYAYGWNIWAVPTEPRKTVNRTTNTVTINNKKKYRVPIPKEWYGLKPEKLMTIDTHLMFCDTEGEMCVVDSKSYARDLCRIIVETNSTSTNS